MVQLDAGVLLVHASDGRDTQLAGDGLAEGAASLAVAAGVEGGASQEQRGRRLAHQGENLGGGLLRLLGEVVVAAHHRAHERAVGAEERHEGAAGADRFGHEPRADAGRLLAADLAEELVEVEDHAHGRLAHRVASDSRPRRRPVRAPLVAPEHRRGAGQL